MGTIASQLGVHHSTVERVLGETGVERERQRPRRPSKLDSYMAFITETLERFPTVANNRVVAPLADAKPFDLITRPTALQRKAFKLLGVRLERTQ